MKLNSKFAMFTVAACLILGAAFFVMMARLQAAPRKGAAPNAVSVDAEDIGGTVTSSKGPEAGVWVIAETSDLQTKFRKIVVTNDHGQYLLPDLPKANYKVWVRGYALVDSRKVARSGGGDRPHATGRRAVLSCELLGFAADDSEEKRFPHARVSSSADTARGASR
jgi:hypothetical protein